MGHQTFEDESNRKHQPITKHHVEDQFEKGETKRNWKTNMTSEVELKIDQNEKENKIESLELSKEKPIVPNSPDSSPLVEPNKEKPIGDPQKESKMTPRLKNF